MMIMMQSRERDSESLNCADDVFIGAAAIVMPGVKIGSSVIGTYDDYVEQFVTLPRWDTHYSKKTNAEKQEMREALAKTRHGFDL